MPSGAITKSETKILVQKVNNQPSDAPWAEDGVTYFLILQLLMNPKQQWIPRVQMHKQTKGFHGCLKQSPAGQVNAFQDF